MNPTLLLVLGLAAIVAGIFAYSAIRWRRSPRVFKAMNYVAALSLIVGMAIGAFATRAILRPASVETTHPASEPTEGANEPTHAASEPIEGASEPAHAASEPGAAASARPADAGPAPGIPVGDVSRALVGTQLRHLMEGKSQPWSAIAKDCRAGLGDTHSLQCEAAFIYDDPHGSHGEWKDHIEVVPYDVVQKFCDAGWADKDSKVCVAAARFAPKSG
jgi:hypothetical protein